MDEMSAASHRKYTLAAELVAAYDHLLGATQAFAASLGNLRLCPSTGSGRSDLFADLGTGKSRRVFGQTEQIIKKHHLPYA